MISRKIYNVLLEIIVRINPINKMEMDIVFKFLNSENKGVLCDIGCSSGQKSIQFAKKGWDVYGIDISKEAIDKANNWGSDYNCHFYYGNAEELEFENHFFNDIICLLSFQHFSNLNKAIEEMYRVLDDEGVVIITVPSTSVPWLKGSYDLTNTRRFDLEELKSILSRNRFEIIDSEYFIRSPIAKYLANYYVHYSLRKFIPLTLIISIFSYPFCILFEHFYKKDGYILALKIKKRTEHKNSRGVEN